MIVPMLRPVSTLRFGTIARLQDHMYSSPKPSLKLPLAKPAPFLNHTYSSPKPPSLLRKEGGLSRCITYCFPLFAEQRGG